MFLQNPENDINERKWRLDSYLPFRHGLIMVLTNQHETSQDFLIFAFMKLLSNKFSLANEELIAMLNAQKKFVGLITLIASYIKSKLTKQDIAFIIENTSLSPDIVKFINE